MYFCCCAAAFGMLLRGARPRALGAAEYNAFVSRTIIKLFMCGWVPPVEASPSPSPSQEFALNFLLPDARVYAEFIRDGLCSVVQYWAFGSCKQKEEGCKVSIRNTWIAGDERAKEVALGGSVGSR